MLCEKFVKDMNLEDADIEIKLVACECLYLVLSEPGNDYMSAENARRECTLLPNGSPEQEVLVKVLDVAGYWSNDLLNILVDYLRATGRESKLVAGYSAIFTWIEAQDLCS